MRRPTTVVEPKSQRVNEQIRVSPIRVIADDGAQLGILQTEEAMHPTGLLKPNREGRIMPGVQATEAEAG